MRVEQLVAAEREQMFEVLDRAFVRSSFERFEADLAPKHGAVLVESEGRICGFTTIERFAISQEGERIQVVSSGDTIVDREAWGTSLIARTWLRVVDEFREDHPGERFVWLLLCSGFRTYRFLPVFWREFHPRASRALPERTAALIQRVATQRFGSQFDQDRGIVRFEVPQVLTESLRAIEADRLRNSDVRFFAEMNPGHERGDELVCWTELHPENQTRAGQRVHALRSAAREVRRA